MSEVMHVTITDTINEVTLLGYVGEQDETGLFVGVGGIKGYWSTPDTKVSLIERTTGNGAFHIPNENILYAARTVTIDVTIRADNRTMMLDLMNSLLYFAGRTIWVMVYDADSATYVEGFATVSFDNYAHEMGMSGVITVVCPDSHRYSIGASEATLLPLTPTGNTGLEYDENGVISSNPVTFLGEVTIANVGTIVNNGTSRAYPTIYVGGNLINGFTLTNRVTGEQLAYEQPVAWAEVKVDCLSRTASIAGVDVTRYLTQKHFPVIEPGESISMALFAAGNGWVRIVSHDTYI